MYLRNTVARALPALMPLILTALHAPALAEDWPQFRGPHRDGRTTQGHLLKSWPADGPRLLWSADGLGKGYASVAVSKGTVYTTGMIDGQGYVLAYDLNGKPKWKKTYGPEWAGQYPGSRTTPTIDGDRLYVISAVGRVVCLNTADGEIEWSVNISDRLGARSLRWGIAESPLIIDDKVICTPGGPEVAVAALDKMTGQTVWTTKGLNETSAYCSPILIKHGQKQLIVTMLQKSIVLIDPANGDLVTRIPHSAQYDISAVGPLYDKGRLFVTNGYGRGSMTYQLSPDATAYEQKWTDKALDCHHGGVVLVNGNVCGLSNNGTLVCLELATGMTKSHHEEIGKGSIIYADGMLYCYEERQGYVRLIKPGITSTDVVSSFKVSRGSGEHWAHPAISDGRLYIRHGESLMVYDIRSPRVGWRNDATGRFPAATVCLEWSEEKNVMWKTPLPDWGNGSPILAKGRIFVCAEPSTLICLKAGTGEILWQRTNHYFDTLSPEESAAAGASHEEHQIVKAELEPLEKELTDLGLRLAGSPTDAWLIKEVADQRKRVKDLKAKLENLPEYKAPATHSTNGYSSSTPTTDGKYVYALFGNGVAACYDTEGNRQWCKFIEAPAHGWGHSASPLLADGKLIVHIVKLNALDCRTGQTLWTAESEARWGSPIAVQLDDGRVIVTSSGSVVRASDGLVLAEGIASLEYSSPVYIDGIVYFIENGGKALKLPNAAPGEFKPTVLWTTKPKKDRYYASPIIYDGLIYAITRACKRRSKSVPPGGRTESVPL